MGRFLSEVIISGLSRISHLPHENERRDNQTAMQSKDLFYCPLVRARQMVSSGDNGTINLTGETKVVEMELGDDPQRAACRRVLEKTWDTYQLRYSNDLVKVVFETAPTINVLYYDSYLNHE